MGKGTPTLGEPYQRELNLKISKSRRDSSIRVREREFTADQKRRARQLRRKDKIKRKTPENFYYSSEWRMLRYHTLRKFGFKCLACGRGPTFVRLHVDHIKPRSTHPELSLDPDNLQVLCEDCNLGKSNFFSDDLRPK